MLLRLEADDRNKLPSSALPDSIFRIHDVTMREVEDFESDPELNFSWEAYEKSQCPPPISSFRPSPIDPSGGSGLPRRKLARIGLRAARRALARSVLSHPAYQSFAQKRSRMDSDRFPLKHPPLFCQAVAEVLQPVFPIDDPEREDISDSGRPARNSSRARHPSKSRINASCTTYWGLAGWLTCLHSTRSSRRHTTRTGQRRTSGPCSDELWHIVERSELPWPDPLTATASLIWKCRRRSWTPSTRRCILGQKRSETISSACGYLRAINNEAAAAELEAEFVVARNARPEECKWLDTADCKDETPPLAGRSPAARTA